MLTAVRDTSIEAFVNHFPVLMQAGDAIVDCILSHPEGCTRRQIAKELGIMESTVSGLVRPRLNRGVIFESQIKMPCPVTGNRVYWLYHPANNGQRSLFA